MKIAVSSDDGKTISSHFGRSRGFAIYDLEDDRLSSVEFRTHSFGRHAHGGSGAGHAQRHHHGPLLARLDDCDVIIAHGMGHRIYDDLVRGGKQVFVTSETEVETAVQGFKDNTLAHDPRLTCGHAHRTGGCGLRARAARGADSTTVSGP
jgi:predicted Fe-Mo cluster-binding NifX family protein